MYVCMYIIHVYIDKNINDVCQIMIIRLNIILNLFTTYNYVDCYINKYLKLRSIMANQTTIFKTKEKDLSLQVKKN